MNETHWTYIALAYGVTAATILFLLIRILLEHRRLRGELARLEKNGAVDREEAL